MLSFFKKDFEINKTMKSRLITFTFRVGNYLHFKKVNILFKVFLKIFYIISNFLIIQIMAGADIPAACEIGKGFFVQHGAKGIVIHPDVVIGENLRIFHQVTIGANDPRKESGYGTPVIGNNVFIGAGAKIIGPIIIGDNALIGANAVVTKNVPANHTVIGNPAILLETKES